MTPHLDEKPQSRDSDRWWVASLGMSYLAALGWASSSVFVVPVLVMCLPFILLIYVEIHERAHRIYSANTLGQHTQGLLFSCLLGFSWRIYLRHHANHHRFGDTRGDYAITSRADGSPQRGLVYITKNAVFAFILQCVPFLSVAAMQRKHRDWIAWLDESARVTIRATWYLAFGLGGLLVLLTYQLAALSFILYVNYVQHFATETPRRFDGKLFNTVFRGIGIHDRHHSHPTMPGSDLIQFSSAETLGGFQIFHPLTLALFCISSRGLARRLKGGA